MYLTTVAVLLVLTAVSFQLGRRRALAGAGGDIAGLHSLPGYYGMFVALWCALPALLLLLLGWAFEGNLIEQLVIAGLPDEMQALPANELSLLYNDIRNLANADAMSGAPTPVTIEAADRLQNYQTIFAAALGVLALVLAIAGLTMAQRLINPDFRARNRVERIFRVLLIGASTIAILTTIGIVVSLLFEAMRFFAKVPFTEFLFGIHWSPQTALRADQVASEGEFGAIPIFAGTMLISLIALTVAVPIGLMAAIYMAEYAAPKVRATVKPLLEILAGIPTVVYGFFAALTIAPILRDSGTVLGLDVASESALAAGLVMGVMIIPFVSSLSDDVISAVPQSLREGSYGLGATKSETIRQVILPAALPGVVGAVLLAASRAIGETMIVVMAAGLAANLTANPFEAVTTVTVQIVTLLVGDQEFDSAKTLAAFALGLVLFVVTLCLNIFALAIVKKYRERYD
ncbi:MAG: phosphate ABC transporter permease subunit PstC [Alphaproteobacteria bacterium]